MKNRIITVLLTISLMCSFALIFGSAADAKLGDVNGDGKVNAADARETLRISAGLTVATDEQKLLADANGDGKVTAYDARMILRAAAKIEALPEMPTSETSTESTTAEEPSTEEPSTEGPLPEPDTGIVVDSYPEAIDAFFSGSFYLDGAMGDSESPMAVKMATNKTGTEIVMDIKGKAQLSIFAKKNVSYMKLTTEDGKKYYVELTKAMIEQYGIDFNTILGEFSFAVIENPGKPILTKGEYNGKACDIYSFKKDDGSEMIFYADGDDVVKIAAEDVNGAESTAILVNDLSGKIPSTMLTIKGFKETSILMLPSLMPDFT